MRRYPGEDRDMEPSGQGFMVVVQGSDVEGSLSVTGAEQAEVGGSP